MEVKYSQFWSGFAGAVLSKKTPEWLQELIIVQAVCMPYPIGKQYFQSTLSYFTLMICDCAASVYILDEVESIFYKEIHNLFVTFV